MPFDPQPLITLIQEKLDLNKETERGLCEEIGLDKSSIRRIREGQRPSITTLILLANRWHISPNDMLELGGWPRLAFFETGESALFSSEVVEIALNIEAITDEDQRARIMRVIRTLLGVMVE